MAILKCAELHLVLYLISPSFNTLCSGLGEQKCNNESEKHLVKLHYLRMAMLTV